MFKIGNKKTTMSIDVALVSLNISTGQKIELCPTKAGSQRRQLSGVKLKKTVSYRSLKTQKGSVSIGLSYSFFSFHEHFNWRFTYAVFL